MKPQFRNAGETRFVLAALVFFGLTAIRGENVELKNHYDFPLRMPVSIPWKNNDKILYRIDGRTAQPDHAGRLHFIGDFDPVKTNSSAVKPLESETVSTRTLNLISDGNSISIISRDKSVGKLTWGVLDKNAIDCSQDDSSYRAAVSEMFTTVPIHFSKTDEGPVFVRYAGSAEINDTSVSLSLTAYNGGYLDIDYTPRTVGDGEAAFCVKWDTPAGKDVSICNDGSVTPPGGTASNSKTGYQWARATVNNVHCLWMENSPRNTGLVHHVIHNNNDTIYFINNIFNCDEDKQRPIDTIPNVSVRMVFTGQPISDERAKQIYLGFSGVKGTQVNPERAIVTVGVPETRFGVSYTPDVLPNVAYTDFGLRRVEDKIVTEIRIANWAGIKIIRLPHLDRLYANPNAESLIDTLVNEIHGLGMKVVPVIKTPDKHWRDFIDRYGTTIAGIEKAGDWSQEQDLLLKKEIAKNDIPIYYTPSQLNNYNLLKNNDGAIVNLSHEENEKSTAVNPWKLIPAWDANHFELGSVLTDWGWKSLLNLTGVDRSRELERQLNLLVGLKSVKDYILFDWIEEFPIAIENAKDAHSYSLVRNSLLPRAGLAEFVGTVSKNSTANSFHKVLESPYAVAQLNENGTGNMTYYLVNTSKSVLNFDAIIEEVPDVAIGFNTDDWTSQTQITLEPGMEASLQVYFRVAEAMPGIYPILIRCDADKFSTPRYLWGNANLPGKPYIDTAKVSGTEYLPNAAVVFRFPVDNRITVVYGDSATEEEKLYAKMVAVTLEEACGVSVDTFAYEKLPKNLRRDSMLIVVGNYNTNPLIAEIFPQESLDEKLGAVVKRTELSNNNGQNVIGIFGKDADGVVKSAKDFIGRYRMDAESRFRAKR